MKLLLFLVFAASWVAADPAREPAPADLPEVTATHNLHFELTIITLPRNDAAPMIEALKDDARKEATYGQLTKMVEQRKAEVVSIATLICLPGERAVTEDVEELRYATDYAPPYLTLVPPITPPPKAEPAQAPKKAEPQPGEPSPEGALEMEPATVAGMAVSFETRKLGTVLECGASLDAAAKRIALVIEASHTVSNGMAKHSVVADGKTSVVEQPRIFANKVNTRLVLTSGERVLLGTFRAPAKEGWTELFLLRATAQPLK